MRHINYAEILGKQFSSSAVQQFSSSAVQQFSSSAVQQFSSSAVQQFSRSAGQQVSRSASHGHKQSNLLRNAYRARARVAECEYGSSKTEET